MNESVNRAFMYGESVFTTMRMVQGSVRDWELHFTRLSQGVEFVYGPFTEGEKWRQVLRDRLEKRLSSEEADQVIRLTLYREQERGLRQKRPISLSELHLHVSVSPYQAEKPEKKSWRLRTAIAPSKPSWWPAFLKCGNYLETILIQKKFMGPDDDDILFLSLEGNVLESSVANIFIYRNGSLSTAPAGPQVLEGVMRKKVLQQAPGIFGRVIEAPVSKSELANADGIFGTNSVRGLFLISRIDDHELNASPEFLEKFEMLKREIE